MLRRRSLSSAKQLEVVANSAEFLALPYDEVGAIGAGMSSGNRRGMFNRIVGCTITPVGCIGADLAIRNNASPQNRDKNFLFRISCTFF